MNGVPPIAFLGGALLLLIVGVMASKSSGPTYEQSAARVDTGSIEAYRAQVTAEAEMASTGIGAVLQYDQQRKAYDLGVLDLQTKAQTEKANLEAAERMYNRGADVQEKIGMGQIDAQNRQTANESQGGIFDFILGAAKTILPFFF